MSDQLNAALDGLKQRDIHQSEAVRLFDILRAEYNTGRGQQQKDAPTHARRRSNRLQSQARQVAQHEGQDPVPFELWAFRSISPNTLDKICSSQFANILTQIQTNHRKKIDDFAHMLDTTTPCLILLLGFDITSSLKAHTAIARIKSNCPAEAILPDLARRFHSAKASLSTQQSSDLGILQEVIVNYIPGRSDLWPSENDDDDSTQNEVLNPESKAHRSGSVSRPRDDESPERPTIYVSDWPDIEPANASAADASSTEQQDVDGVNSQDGHLNKATPALVKKGAIQLENTRLVSNDLKNKRRGIPRLSVISDGFLTAITARLHKNEMLQSDDMVFCLTHRLAAVKDTVDRDGSSDADFFSGDFLVFDPGFPFAESFSGLIRSPETFPRHLLFFFNYRNHWTFGHLDRQTGILKHYDSNRSGYEQGILDSVKKRMQGWTEQHNILTSFSMEKTAVVNVVECEESPQQNDEVNCSIFAIECAVALITSGELPSAVDPVALRKQFLELGQAQLKAQSKRPRSRSPDHNKAKRKKVEHTQSRHNNGTQSATTLRCALVARDEQGNDSSFCHKAPSISNGPAYKNTSNDPLDLNPDDLKYLEPGVPLSDKIINVLLHLLSALDPLHIMAVDVPASIIDQKWFQTSEHSMSNSTVLVPICMDEPASDNGHWILAVLKKNGTYLYDPWPRNLHAQVAKNKLGKLLEGKEHTYCLDSVTMEHSVQYTGSDDSSGVAMIANATYAVAASLGSDVQYPQEINAEIWRQALSLLLSAALGRTFSSDWTDSLRGNTVRFDGDEPDHTTSSSLGIQRGLVNFDDSLNLLQSQEDFISRQIADLHKAKEKKEANIPLWKDVSTVFGALLKARNNETLTEKKRAGDEAVKALDTLKEQSKKLNMGEELQGLEMRYQEGLKEVCAQLARRERILNALGAVVEEVDGAVN